MGECAHGRLRDEEHPQAVEAARSAAEVLALAHARDRPRRQPADTRDRGEGLGSAHAVGSGAGVALELAQRLLARGAEDAVFAPASKPIAFNRRWSSATSSPRNIGAVR